MPLSPAAPRKFTHVRNLDCRGYQREDGFLEVEGHLRDSRGYDMETEWRGPVRSGEAIHEMWMRITFDLKMLICAVEVVTDASPYPELCKQPLKNYQRLVGEHIGPGFVKRVRKHIEGIAGCTHVTELLRILGSLAMQTMNGYMQMNQNTLSPVKAIKSASIPAERPRLLNSCYSFAEDSDVARVYWPDHYTGPGKKEQDPSPE